MTKQAIDEEEYDEGSQIPDSELGDYPDNSSSS
jgi:hypothetical protein